MGYVLERAHVRLRPRRTAADQENRRAGEVGIGHAGHAIGDAGTGGDEANAGFAGQLGVGLRHMYGGAFVADIDDFNAPAGDEIPDRLDVSALQAEDPGDAATLQAERDIGGDTVIVRIQVHAGHRGVHGGYSVFRQRRGRHRLKAYRAACGAGSCRSHCAAFHRAPGTPPGAGA